MLLSKDAGTRAAENASPSAPLPISASARSVGRRAYGWEATRTFEARARRNQPQDVAEPEDAASPVVERSFGRQAYSEEVTQALPAAAPMPIEPTDSQLIESRDLDAPIPMKRTEASLQPSAPLLAANAQARILDEAARQDELARFLAESIDDSDDIRVTVMGPLVILEGRVSSEIDRLLAEDLVFTRLGIFKCRNMLVVEPSEADEAA